jgi:hypothetical protein
MFPKQLVSLGNFFQCFIKLFFLIPFNRIDFFIISDKIDTVLDWNQILNYRPRSLRNLHFIRIICSWLLMVDFRRRCGKNESIPSRIQSWVILVWPVLNWDITNINWPSSFIFLLLLSCMINKVLAGKCSW